jgi:hypothetical protein
MTPSFTQTTAYRPHFSENRWFLPGRSAGGAGQRRPESVQLLR